MTSRRNVSVEVPGHPEYEEMMSTGAPRHSEVQGFGAENPGTIVPTFELPTQSPWLKLGFLGAAILGLYLYFDKKQGGKFLSYFE